MSAFCMNMIDALLVLAAALYAIFSTTSNSDD